MDEGIMSFRMEKWRNVILLQMQSGQTKTEWCEQNGVRLRQFQYWNKKLRDHEMLKIKQNGSETDESDITTIVPTDSSSTQVFAELRCLDTSSSSDVLSVSSALQNASSDSGISISLNDFKLNIANSFSEGTLLKVLRVLQDVK